MNDITRRDALALGVSAAALAPTGASAQSASTDQGRRRARPQSLRIEKGASLRMLRPVRFVQAGRSRVPRQRRQIQQGNRRRGQGRLRRLGRHQPADRGNFEFRRRPRHDHRLLRRAAHLHRQAGRADRRRRLSRQALWRLAAAGAKVRQAQQERCLDRIAVRRHRRPPDLPQIHSAIGRLRQDPGRLCRNPRPVPQAAEGRQAGRLRTGQCQEGDGNGFANWVLWSHNASLLDEKATSSSTARRRSPR